jgi:hypothetical protein
MIRARIKQSFKGVDIVGIVAMMNFVTTVRIGNLGMEMKYMVRSE